MKKDLIVGIDAGTSVIKSVAFDMAGKQVDSFSVANSYETPRVSHAEQEMSGTWENTVTTLNGLAGRIANLADRCLAIAVTGQGDGTWLIDADGEPVAPALLWLDARASAIVDEFRSGAEDQSRFEKTATGLAACQQGPQMMWMKRHSPEVLSRAATAFHCKDWLYFKLSGERATDPSEGVFSFGDFRRRDYSDDVIAMLGLEDYRRLMPPIVDGTLQTAGLSKEAASVTGLLSGTPVVLGFVDVICTALGAGLYERSAALGCTIIGSTGMHMRLVQSADEVVFNGARTGYTMAMPVPGVYAQMQSNMASTLNIDWLLDMAVDLLASQGISKSRSELVPMVDSLLAGSRPSGILYQPYVSEAGERGPFINADARAGFIGLSTAHGFSDLMRAVVDGLALAARDCYQTMGKRPDEIRLTGGAARSTAIRGIFGAAVGARVRTSQREEAGAAGAAMMAAVALGQYPDMDACAKEWVSPYLGGPEQPDETLAGYYDETYPVYASAPEALGSIWKKLAHSRGEDR